MRGLFTVLAMGFGLIMGGTGVHAEDAHTIKLNLPDQIALKTVTSSTSSVQMSGVPNQSPEPQVTSSRDEFRYDVTRIDGGYRIKRNGLGAPREPWAANPEADILGEDMARTELIYTTDANMVALKVENLDAVKSALKAALEKATDAKYSLMIYNSMFGSMTPESAASLLLSNDNMVRGFYNRPMKLSEAIDSAGINFSFMGSNLAFRGRSTLTDWKDGQSAHVSTLLQPDEAEFKAFMRQVIKGMFSSMPEDNPQLTKIMDMIMQEFTMTMQTRCEADVDLKTGLITHSECDTNARYSINMEAVMKAMMPEGETPPSEVKALSGYQESKVVSDTQILN